MTPPTFMPTLLAMWPARSATRSAAIWGVVTRIMRVPGANWAREIEMSPVPGGMSMSRYSGSSQCTSERNCWRALCSIGPRQTTGLSSGTKLPIEIILKPWASGGMMSRSSTTVGFSRTPSIRGIEKPQTSASRRPTVWPRLASIAARLTVVVDLPTPPLPLPMARTVVEESGPAIGAMSLF